MSTGDMTEEEYRAAFEASLVGQTCKLVLDEGGWKFVLSKATMTAYLQTPWRVVKDGRILFSGADHGHHFGLGHPFDVVEAFDALFDNGLSLTAATIDGDTGDLRLNFGPDLRIEMFNNSGGHESFQAYSEIGGEWAMFVAFGGGIKGRYVPAPSSAFLTHGATIGLVLRPPIGALPSDEMGKVASLARAQPPLSRRPGKISAAFSVSGDKGIVVDCHLDFGQQKVALELFKYPDPFAPKASSDDASNDVFCTAFDTWLSSIEEGNSPSIAFDCEGSCDALAILLGAYRTETLTLVYCESTYLVVRAVVRREDLLRAFRSALTSFRQTYPDPWAAVTELMMSRKTSS